MTIIKQAFSEEDLKKGELYRLTGESVCAKCNYLEKDIKGFYMFIHNFRGTPLLWKTKEIDFTENGKIYIPETAEVQRDWDFNKRNRLEELK